MADACSGRLYEVLEVPKTATANEIKKAYYKKALQLHPDKTNGTTTEEFKSVQEANAILSDPEKRTLYDRLGRAGMARLEQYGMGGFAAGAMANPLAIKAIGTVFFLIFFLLLLFVALVVSKIDNQKDWSWAVVFIPIWILLGVSVLAPFAAIGALIKLRFKEAFSLLATFGMLISIIFFVKVIDGDFEWETFFIPVFVTAGLYYLGELLGLRLGYLREMLAAQGHPAAASLSATHPLYIQTVVSVLFNIGCHIAFFILMFRRLTGRDANLSFYLAFTPLFVNLSVPTVISSVANMCNSAVRCKEKLCLLIVSLITLGCTLYTYVMIAVKLQKEWNENTDGPSAAVCAIMLFVLFGIFVLLSCCACCCFSLPPPTDDGDSYHDVAAAEEGASTAKGSEAAERLSAATTGDDGTANNKENNYSSID